MKQQLFTKWYVRYAILLACILILIIVPLFRGDLKYPDNEAYFNFRLADDLKLEDNLSFGGRFVGHQLATPIILSPTPEILINILPLLLGVISFLLIWLIIKRFIQDMVIEKISMILILLSPAFVYLFSFGNSLFIPIFLSILAFFLFTQKRFSWMAIPIILILPLFNLIILIGLAICMFFYSFFYNKEKKRLFLILLLVGLTSSMAFYGFVLYKNGLPNMIDIEDNENLIERLVYDFGSEYGIGIFLLVISIMGIIAVWNKKYSNLFVFFSVCSLLIISFFRMEGLFFLNIFLCVLGAYGIVNFIERKSESGINMYITIILICGLAFSMISQLDSLSQAKPDRGVIDAIEYLKGREEGVVFSDYSRGVWINYAGQKNVLDEDYLFVKDAKERFKDMNAVYSYRDLDGVNRLFDKYDVKYIWIDEEMKNEIWNYDTEGLLFILEYTKDYVKLYNKGGVEIWVRADLG